MGHSVVADEVAGRGDGRAICGADGRSDGSEKCANVVVSEDVEKAFG